MEDKRHQLIGEGNFKFKIRMLNIDIYYLKKELEKEEQWEIILQSHLHSIKYMEIRKKINEKEKELKELKKDLP